MAELQRIYEGIAKIDQIRSLGTTANIDMRGRDIPPGVGYEIGQHLAETLSTLGQGYLFISGDGRISTPGIIDELTDAVTGKGITVINAGYGNITPLFEVMRERMGVSGVNVTASHQSAEYNGCKVVIEAEPTNNIPDEYHTARNNAGVIHAQEYCRQEYLEDLTGRLGEIRSGSTVLFDGLQGSSFPFFEAMANKLGIPYRAVRAGLNGYFPLTVSGPDPGKIGNIQMLGNLVDVEQFSLGVHVDGDGDRMGASRHGKIIPAPYLGALRALQAGPGKFIMEYCLASIVMPCLEQHDINVIAVSRSRPSHISAIRGTPQATGGQELSLHPYNAGGIDDAIEASLRLIDLDAREGIENQVDLIRRQCRPFVPEIRIKTSRPSKPIVEEIFSQFPDAYDAALVEGGRLVDGIIVESEDFAVYIRGSSNENALTVNVNGDPGKLPSLIDGIADQIESVETGAREKIMSEYKTVGGVVQ